MIEITNQAMESTLHQGRINVFGGPRLEIADPFPSLFLLLPFLMGIQGYNPGQFLKL